jgi:hypothetical protein
MPDAGWILLVAVAVAVAGGLAALLLVLFRRGRVSVDASGPHGTRLQLRGEQPSVDETTRPDIDQQVRRARNVSARSQKGTIRQRVRGVRGDVSAEQG